MSWDEEASGWNDTWENKDYVGQEFRNPDLARSAPMTPQYRASTGTARKPTTTSDLRSRRTRADVLLSTPPLSTKSAGSSKVQRSLKMSQNQDDESIPDAIANVLDEIEQSTHLIKQTTECDSSSHGSGKFGVELLVNENVTLRDELVACKSTIAELEYQGEKDRLRIRALEQELQRVQSLDNSSIYIHNQPKQTKASTWLSASLSGLSGLSDFPLNLALTLSNRIQRSPRKRGSERHYTTSGTNMKRQSGMLLMEACKRVQYKRVLHKVAYGDWGMELHSTLRDGRFWMHVVGETAPNGPAARGEVGKFGPGLEVIIAIDDTPAIYIDGVQVAKELRSRSTLISLIVITRDDLEDIFSSTENDDKITFL